MQLNRNAIVIVMRIVVIVKRSKNRNRKTIVMKLQVSIVHDGGDVMYSP
jgi:hypothetical protein